MTNEEIIRMQREATAHREAVPGALRQAHAVLSYFNGRDNCLLDGGMTAGTLRTLVKEVERLQAALKQANQDIRDEQREARYSAANAYADGRHDGIEESRGY